MKLFHVAISPTDYYEIDHMVVVAADRDEAAELYYRESGFCPSPGELEITEVDTAPGIVFRTYTNSEEARCVEYR